MKWASQTTAGASVIRWLPRRIKASEDTRLRFSLTMPECLSFSDRNSEDKETD